MSVYFSGTGHEIENNEMLAGMVHTTTLIDEQHAKMGFNGCGIEYGCRGMIFGTGLEEECDQVVEKASEQRDYAYFFAREKSSVRVAPSNSPAPEMNFADKIALFADFLKQIFADGMSNVSRYSDKGARLYEAIDELQKPETIEDEIHLKDVMRNGLAICLQRDRNRLSPFSMTHSGIKAKELLNSKKYRAIALMILSTHDKNIRYRDLRIFVIGRNDERFFNAQRSQDMYQFFQPKFIPLSNSKLLTNNMGFYLKR